MDGQTPGMGHNKPDSAAALQDSTDQLAAACNGWLAQVPKIENEDQEKKAVDFIARLNAELKDVEDARMTEKRPHLDANIAIDATYKPINTKLETIKKLLTPKLTAWMDKKEAARKEAARIAEEEALRKMEEAESARKAAEQAEAQAHAPEATDTDVVGTVLEAESARKAADEAVKAADKIAKSTTKAKGNYGTRAISLRTAYSAEITDLDAAIDHWRDHPKMADLIQDFANAWARSPEARKTPIPGVKLHEEKNAA